MLVICWKIASIEMILESWENDWMMQSFWCGIIILAVWACGNFPLLVLDIAAGSSRFRNDCMAPYNASSRAFGGSRSVRFLDLNYHFEYLMLINVIGKCRPNARFMFKRIPYAIASEDECLQKAHEILQRLWNKMYRGAWDVIHSPWPSKYAMIIEHLSSSTRQEIFRVLQGAYVNIDAKKLSKYLGCSIEQAVEYSTARGACYKGTVVMMPRMPQERGLPESEIQKLQSILVQLGQ